MASSLEKENSGRTFSPSAYLKHVDVDNFRAHGRSPLGLMARINEAKEDAREHKDKHIAGHIQRKVERELEEASKEAEEEDRMVAERIATEEKDAAPTDFFNN
eukprot:g3155.t1